MIVAKKEITLATVFYPSEKAVYDEDAVFKVGLRDIGRSTIKPIITRVGVAWLGWLAVGRSVPSVRVGTT
jgi:hypothetical protein